MKLKKKVSFTSLLNGVNSSELLELRKQFNAEVSDRRYELELAEKREMKSFVDNLQLDRRYGDSNILDVVSLNRYSMQLEQRKRLNDISETIGRAFHDLDDLKQEVARYAKSAGKPFSEVFHTTVKRMTRYKNR